MISLKKSVMALEQLEALQQALVESYSGTIEDMSAAAIVLRADNTKQHRATLKSLSERMAGAGSPREVEKLRATLKDELFSYQRSGAVLIDGLRDSVSTISRVLEEVTSTMGKEQGSETDAITLHLKELQSLAATNDIEKIRTGLKNAVVGITNSVETLKRQNKLIVAQFKEEIRTLHTQLKAVPAPAPQGQIPGPTPGAKTEIISRPPSSVTGPVNPAQTEFSLLALWIRNWKTHFGGLSPQAKIQAYESFLQAFARAMGYKPVVNRYDEDVLMTRLNMTQPEALRISKELTETVWPDYLIADTRKLVTWRVATGIVTGRAGESPETLTERFDQLAQRLKRSV